MSYQIYDANGFVTEIATCKSQLEMMEYIRGLNDPDLIMFADEGEITLTNETKAKIKSIPTAKVSEVEICLQILRRVVDKCDGTLILFNGITVDHI